MTLRDAADEVLMAEYQNGDARAFEVLLLRHQRPIYNFIYRFVRRRDIAEDLLQETFLRVVKGAANYKQQAKFTTWLYTIARNLCVDQSRRAKHRRHPSLDQPMTKKEDAGSLMDIIPSTVHGSERNNINKQMMATIEEAVAALSDEQREVFLMREFHDLPFKDIAAIVGVSENTIKSRMRYALEKLRAALVEYEDIAKANPVG